MNVIFNTDSNINGRKELSTPVIALIKEQLDRYSNLITRVEVHLSDENSHKEGPNDKRCLLEARIEGRQPIAVACNANSYDQSISGAIEKLLASLDKILGRLKNHQQA